MEYSRFNEPSFCLKPGGGTTMLQSVIQSGKAQGMQLMDDALFALVKEKRILPLDAYLKAKDKSRFEPLLDAPPESVT